MKVLASTALLILSVVLMASFLLDASYLDRTLPFGLAAGVAAAAISLIAAAWIPIIFAPRGSKLRTSAIASFVAAALWLPVTVCLAGGFVLHLSGWRSSAWLAFTGVLLLAIACNLIGTLVAAFRARNSAAA